MATEKSDRAKERRLMPTVTAKVAAHRMARAAGAISHDVGHRGGIGADRKDRGSGDAEHFVSGWTDQRPRRLRKEEGGDPKCLVNAVVKAAKFS